MATRIARGPAVAWLTVLIGAMFFLIWIDAPWWAFALWVVVVVLGPGTVKAAFVGYVADERGVPIEKALREGVIGDMARWAVTIYETLVAIGAPGTSHDVVKAAISSMHRAGLAPLLAVQLARLNARRNIHGLVHLVLLIVAAGPGVAREQRLRLPLIRVLEELVMLKGKVPARYALGERGAGLGHDPEALDDLFWPAITDIMEQAP